MVGEVGLGLGFEALGDRVGHRLPGRLAGQLEGEGGHAQPGDAERPAAQHVGDVVHAEQDPADPDQHDQRGDPGGEGAPPAAAHHRQEDQEQGAVADDRAERVPAGEAVPLAVRHRVRHHRAEPADQRLEHRIEHQHAAARHQQVDRQPPAVPERQQERRRPDERPQHPAAAQPGDRLHDGDGGGVTGDQAVEPGRGVVVGGLQRGPLQPYQHEQYREHQGRHRDHHEGGQAPVRTAGRTASGRG